MWQSLLLVHVLHWYHVFNSAKLLTTEREFCSSWFDVVAIASPHSVDRVIRSVHNVKKQVPGRCSKAGSPFESIPTRSNSGTNGIIPNTPQGLQSRDLCSMLSLVVCRVGVSDGLREEQMVVMIRERDDGPVFVAGHLQRRWKQWKSIERVSKPGHQFV